MKELLDRPRSGKVVRHDVRGSGGCPDLPGHARENAAQIYDSIHGKLLTLPDLEVFPAHFSKSMCGAGMSGKPSTTIAFEKRWNPLFGRPKEEFVSALADVPSKPAAMDEILLADRFN